MARRKTRSGEKRSRQGSVADLGSALLGALETGGRPALSARALAGRLGIAQDRSGSKRIQRALRNLVAEGRVLRDGRRFRAARNDGLIEARLERARGVVVAVDDSGQRLTIVDPGVARVGDRVALLPAGERSQPASVVSVLVPSGGRCAGVFQRGPRGGVVETLGAQPVPYFRIASDQARGAREGELVLAAAAERGRSREPWARIVERLGWPGDPDADFAAMVERHRLPVDFSQQAEQEARDVQRRLARASKPAARDLTGLPFVTIDPASARDHDDAVCVEADPTSDDLHLWVAIADVGAYVAPGGAIDREALLRGNSVYFPDRSIPMLPHSLSSGACSLVPDEDRRVLVVSLRVLPNGRVRDARFARARIRSRARLSYDEALLPMKGAGDVAASVRESLAGLRQVAARLRAERFGSGALDLDLPETRILLDERGRPSDARTSERHDAHRAIEEAMLAANRAVAARLAGRGAPCIHRVHEPPAPADAAALRGRLARLGLMPAGRRGEAAELPIGELAAAVARARGRDEESWLQLQVLRSMRQARYSPRSLGHYALGFSAYCHFTSPIRRYSDLVVHRSLIDQLGSGASAKPEQADLESLALRLSLRERVAQKAEREMNELKVCALMADRRGETFEATVSSAARHGLYVRLHSPRVEGLVPIAAFPGELRLADDETALVAARSGRRIAIGDEIRVRLVGINPARGWLSFEPLRTERERPRAATRKKR